MELKNFEQGKGLRIQNKIVDMCVCHNRLEEIEERGHDRETEKSPRKMLILYRS